MSNTLKPAHHGWDHTVGGEDPIPGLGETYDDFMFATFSEYVLANNSETQISWENYGPADGVMSSLQHYANTQPIQILEDGWYTVTCFLNYTSISPFSDVRVLTLQNGDGGGVFDVTGYPYRFPHTNPHSGFHAFCFEVSGRIRSGLGGTSRVQATLWQNSGSTVNVEGAIWVRRESGLNPAVITNADPLSPTLSNAF